MYPLLFSTPPSAPLFHAFSCVLGVGGLVGYNLIQTNVMSLLISNRSLGRPGVASDIAFLAHGDTWGCKARTGDGEYVRLSEGAGKQESVDNHSHSLP